ncbi:transporter substrate-binding domain-containing protein [uncultured Marinobacter sp.]|uniref:substrate-binding periplasmic protein n=1 Tax=uncultured Marinobacter sp. TaxID=187379 RepID=UPI002618A172|nr:transporter substrate-binding domain-containing protein [uncultured Marinobacter sp.]
MRRLWNRHLAPAHFRGLAARIVMVVAMLATVTLSGPVLADIARKKVRIAYTEFPPAEYRNEQGEPAGFFVDLTRKVVEEAGYEPEFIYLPVSRVYLYLKSGAVDLFPGLSGVPTLKYEVLESWVNVYPTRLNAWHLEDSEPLTHFDQLEGKTVIVIGGYTYGGLLSWLEKSGRIRLTEAPNSRAALEMLKLKRGDYVLDYRETVSDMLTRPSDSKIRGSEVRSRYSAWLYSLANPRAAVLREDLDDAYLRLVSRGETPPVRAFKAGFVIPGFPKEHL